MYKKIISISYITLFVYIHDLPASKLPGALWWQSRKRNGQHENNFHTFNTISLILAMPVSNSFVPQNHSLLVQNQGQFHAVAY